jgi:Tol biopolymer transport system component
LKAFCKTGGQDRHEPVNFLGSHTVRAAKHGSPFSRTWEGVMGYRTFLIAVLSILISATGPDWAVIGAPPSEIGADAPTADIPAGTIAFSSLAPRDWDLYLVELATRRTRTLTDHRALDFNAAFSGDNHTLAFVSTRHGNHELYEMQIDRKGCRRLTNEFALDDRPAWSPDGSFIVFSSTREPSDRPGQAWNALYVMQVDRLTGSAVVPANSDHTRSARRISPAGVADYSPAWSPRGDWIACATGSGETGGTDLVVMTPAGKDRRLVVKNGGWPAFAADGQSLFFQSKRQGHWGIWQVALDGSHRERITPEDADVFTPQAARDGKTLVVAVLRGGHRQIARLDLGSHSLEQLTDDAADHWNPAISPDGRFVVYHQRRPGMKVPNVELWGNPPATSLRLLRLAGAFPAFAPTGDRLALTGGSFAQLDLMKLDGSERKTLYEGKNRGLFSTSWAHHGDRIAFAFGPVFAGAKEEVDIATILPDGSGLTQLTKAAGNNGFPAFSPDGRRLVFRSGKGGFKNLAIMDADGRNIHPLTSGKWTDTMADWSPDGEWIVFASDRDGDFEIWKIHPDGMGLKKIVKGGGRNNHPHFAPDGKWIVFTSRRAGYSAEEISLPDQPQPYGDLFIVRLDGTGLLRLTHNGFEEGTPAWGPVVRGMFKPSVEAGLAAEEY